MKDLQGRSYAVVAATPAGALVECDGDFTCMRRGKVQQVRCDQHGLHIHCNDGQHYLAGQLSPCGTYYVGLYPR